MMYTGPTKFELGQVLSTPAALRFCGEHHIDVFALLIRHAQADWGDLTADDKLANDVALVDGARILSSYTFPAGKVWLITDPTDDAGKRQSTLLLLPSEY